MIARTLRHANTKFRANIPRYDCVGPILKHNYLPNLILYRNYSELRATTQIGPVFRTMSGRPRRFQEVDPEFCTRVLYVYPEA